MPESAPSTQPSNADVAAFAAGLVVLGLIVTFDILAVLGVLHR